jgi:large subunit ribosomal protein L5
MPRLQEKFYTELLGELQQKLDISNSMQVPRITKITLNMGVGEAVTNKKALENAIADMQKIAGQKPVKTLARVSVAAYKIRDGNPIGCKVTLRRERMYEFLDRLVNIAIPRTRDFRGLSSKSFDRQGNYSLGVQEQIVFPEIDYDHIDAIRGMDITITTTARNQKEGRMLLEAFNFPFKVERKTHG